MRCVVLATLLGLVDCRHDEAPPPPPPAEKPAAAPPVQKMPSDPDRGSCSLEATGAFAAKETIPGTASSIASKYWLPEDQRGSVQMPALTVNCNGKDLRLSFASVPTATVPYGPKQYALGKNGDLVVLGRAGKALSDFAGTVEIAAFDGHLLTGTIAVTAKQLGGGTVTISGSFDYTR